MLEQLCTTQAVADLHLNQKDVKMFANTENSIIINKEKHLKISKNRPNKFDVGPAIRAYISGCIDACKCTEIFRINVHSRVSNGSESK